MQDLDRLASFYLGKEYDLAGGRVLDQAVNYDARDLTTHAVCLGMTGSGKTGLGAILLEEAALDGVPSIVIDPKGDMTNLLLTFPELRPEDFRPWVNPDDARRQALEPAAYAVQVAERWRKSLADWGQDPERIRRLKEAADFAIYTPGSNTGRRVSILQTLKAPRLSWDTDTEVLRDQIGSVTSALLALVGIAADPVRSREHILLTNILEDAWRAGEDLDLAQVIMRVQKPPFAQLGVFPVETFFPEKNRMELAMLLNGLMAAPSFADWIAGQPLDIDQFLVSPAGKPQVSIFYIAHLAEAERQFFVTLLLQQLVSWLNAQSGTTSLRALLYMDELYGYMPPHPSNPPTKKPLLTLLKQARAFGLGLVLTTQNPVDLDYKALANAGTWFIGRMQTEGDKLRVLDGLEGADVTVGDASRAQLDRLISTLSARVFLLHNVHAGRPLIFQTRWAMSYLRGPLTRAQIRELEGKAAAPAATPVSTAAATPAATAAVETAAQMRVPPAARPAAHAVVIRPSLPAVAPVRPAVAAPGGETPVDGAGLTYTAVPPQLSSAVRQVFMPVQVPLDEALARLTQRQGWSMPAWGALQGQLVYDPALLGLAVVRYAHSRSRQAHDRAYAYLRPASEIGSLNDWTLAEVTLDADTLEHEPAAEGLFGRLPANLGSPSQFKALEKELADHLYYNTTVTVLYNPHLKLYSAPDETSKAFQRRCREAARVARDGEAVKIQSRYQTQLDQLAVRLRREGRELEEDETEYDARKREEFFSGAETVFGAITGRRSRRGASTASRQRRLTKQAKAEVQESEEEIADLEAQIEEMEVTLQHDLDELTERWAGLIDDVQEEAVHPRRGDVRVNLFALAWVPGWEVTVPGQAFPYRVAAFETG